MTRPRWSKENREMEPTSAVETPDDGRKFNAWIVDGRPTMGITWKNKIYIKHYYGLNYILKSMKAFKNSVLSETFFKKHEFKFHSYVIGCEPEPEPEEEKEFWEDKNGNKKRISRFRSNS